MTLWERFEEKDRRFLVQSFRIVSEQLFPYYTRDGKERAKAKAQWQVLHDKLSMELGLEKLSEKIYNLANNQVGFFTPETVCKNFVCVEYDDSVPADIFIKVRISFIEIAFRERGNELEAVNKDLDKEIREAKKFNRHMPTGTIRIPGDPGEGLRALNRRLNQEFRNAVDELNARIRHAGYDLNYHNGFIQLSTDPITEEQIETPFWSLVTASIWKNVDIDMKEAIDRRDNGDRDPAFYAARALESTIKIISDEKGWSNGSERGAHNYIDNLGGKGTDPFIEEWEKRSLKDFFTLVRNPLGHGPGNREMPALNRQQTDWAIEFCMIWVKSLIQRLK